MKYIASWSGGKDSTASIILAHEHGEPLDLIIFSEVMFDKDISGELPEHIDFIKNKAIPAFESWGYETKILHARKTYLDWFNHMAIKGKRIGKKIGFPMAGKCWVNRDCKMPQIKRFLKEIHEDITQYIGIAIDEPVRMERIANVGNKVSLLERYGYTEQMAYDLCKQYDLLSPTYNFAARGGGMLVLPERQESRAETPAGKAQGSMGQAPVPGKRTKPDREEMEHAHRYQYTRLGGTVLLGRTPNDNI